MKIVIDDNYENYYSNESINGHENIQDVVIDNIQGDDMSFEPEETYEEFLKHNVSEKSISKNFKVNSNMDNICIVLDEEDEKGYQKGGYSSNRETSNIEDDMPINTKYKNNYRNNCREFDIPKKGNIVANVRLNDKNGVEISGAKVNLYSISRLNPKLCQSNITDCNGSVEFGNLEDGCYRVIALVDRKFFDKPIYCNWNEFNIDYNCKEGCVTIVLKIKNDINKKKR